VTGVDPTLTLATLLEEPLVVVDVGCRWGFAQAWERLGDRSMIIGFDPDEAECARLSESYRANSQVRVVPQGLGAEAGGATLYVTEDPGGCSLFPSADDAVERHPGLSGGRVTATTEVAVTTLDAWLATEDIDRVDVVKIDTQGSELGVLTGAAQALEAVRAVEVEVEFNELYVDVPLFADLDRFLRQAGFVLWRLKDLSHYAQRGVRRDWRAPEAQYFDDLVARFESGSGQLFWANAFYLKRDVAYPAAELGWRSLVRDACVTSAFGFHDLVGLAIGCAAASAPPEVAALLAAAGREDAAAAEDEHRLGEEAVVLEGSHRVDLGDASFRGSGWRAPQVLPMGTVRWTGPQREASIDLALRLVPGSTVELVAVTAMSPAILEQLVLEVNRVAVPLERSPHEWGVLFTGMLPPDYRSPRLFTRLVLRTPETIPWNELHPESTDDAELGIALTSVRVTAPPKR
jgi:FkbM family methyltransferase